MTQRRLPDLAMTFPWMHRCATLVLAVLVCLWPARAAQATADGPDYYRAQGIAPGTSVPLLAAPRSDAPPLGGIGSAATCLRNLGCQGGLSLEEFSTLSEAAKQQRLAANPRWCQVAYQGRIGWVPGRYLAESATACADARSADPLPAGTSCDCAMLSPRALAVLNFTTSSNFAGCCIERRYGNSIERKEVILSEVQRLTDVELDMLIALKANQAGIAPVPLLLAQSEQ